MRRKSWTALTLSALILATLLAIPVSPVTPVLAADEDNGLILASAASFGGAYIDVKKVGLVAGKSYTIEFNVAASGTTTYRVRYTDGTTGNFKHNDETDRAHSSPSATTNGLVANQVPAYFENSIPPLETKVLTVNFTFGASIAGLSPLTMDYIGFFGGQGADSYQVLGIRLKDASGNVMASAGDMESTDGMKAPTYEDNGKYNSGNFFTLKQEGGTKYQLHTPANPEAGKKYPVLIRLHGLGLSDFVEYYPIKGGVGFIEGFISLVNQDPETYESYVVMMSSPDWGPSPSAVKAIIDRLVKDESVDTDRIYIYGFSMGGYTTSEFIMTYPDTAAAAVLICGTYEPSAETAKKLVNLPIRLYHSDDDKVVSVEDSRNFNQKMQAAGTNKTEYFELTGYGHNAQTYAYKGMAEWMFAQTKKPAEQTYPATAAARPSK